jgi:hypothetical protein
MTKIQNAGDGARYLADAIDHGLLPASVALFADHLKSNLEWTLVISGFALYFLFHNCWNGISVGKFIARIRLVDAATFRPIPFGKALKRSGLVYGSLLGTLAICGMLSWLAAYGGQIFEVAMVAGTVGAMVTVLRYFCRYDQINQRTQLDYLTHSVVVTMKSYRSAFC